MRLTKEQMDEIMELMRKHRADGTIDITKPVKLDAPSVSDIVRDKMEADRLRKEQTEKTKAAILKDLAAKKQEPTINGVKLERNKVYIVSIDADGKTTVQEKLQMDTEFDPTWDDKVKVDDPTPLPETYGDW